MRNAGGFRAAGNGGVTADSSLGSRVPPRRPWYETALPPHRRTGPGAGGGGRGRGGDLPAQQRLGRPPARVGIPARAQGLQPRPLAAVLAGPGRLRCTALSLLPRLAGRALKCCDAGGGGARRVSLPVGPHGRARGASRPQKPTVFAATVATLFRHTFTPVAKRGIWTTAGSTASLLFFLTAAGWFLVRGRQVLAGFWLAVAIVYKTSPLIFLPFLLWKRQWRIAGWTVAFAVLLSILAGTVVRGRATIEYHRRTLDTMLRSTAVGDPADN